MQLFEWGKVVSFHLAQSLISDLPLACQGPLSLILFWFNPTQHPLTHPFTTGIRKRIRKVEVRKLMGWDKDSSTGRAKAVCTNKLKQGIFSPLPMSRQMFSHLQDGRCASHRFGKTKSHHPKHFYLPPSASLLYTEHDVSWSEMSFG